MSLYLNDVVSGLSRMYEPIQELVQHPSQAQLYNLFTQHSYSGHFSPQQSQDPVITGLLYCVGIPLATLGVIYLVGTYVQSRNRQNRGKMSAAPTIDQSSIRYANPSPEQKNDFRLEQLKKKKIKAETPLLGE